MKQYLWLVTLDPGSIPGLKHLDEVMLECVVRAPTRENAKQIAAKHALQETQAPWLDGRAEVAEIGVGIFPTREDEGMILARTSEISPNHQAFGTALRGRR
jgi:hypothetical protein